MSGVLAAVVAVISILTGLTGVATFLAIGRQRGRVIALEARAKDLADQAQDLRNDVTDRDRRIVYLETDRDRMATELEAQRLQMDAMGKIITGEVHIAALHDLIDREFGVFRDTYHTLPGAMAQLLAAQRELNQLMVNHMKAGA